MNDPAYENHVLAVCATLEAMIHPWRSPKPLTFEGIQRAAANAVRRGNLPGVSQETLAMWSQKVPGEPPPEPRASGASAPPMWEKP